MNSENSKTYNPHWVVLNLMDKVGSKRTDRSIALSSSIFCHTILGKLIKKAHKNYRFRKSASISF